MTGKGIVGIVSEYNAARRSDPSTRTETLSYFILTILGFSFWFFMAVPFASHRESYWWLGMVQTEHFAKAFGLISSTYRPLAQAVTWLGFLILDPSVFPTSVLRQTLLQVFIFGMFVLAWWLIYTAAPRRRLFALVAVLAGGVFFSSYVQLFHIYGVFYVPVVLTLGALLRLHAAGTFEQREVWFAVIAILLAFWHPFATALFLGFYFGFCLDTLRQRSRAQRIQAVVILIAGAMAIATLVVLFPVLPTPLHTKLFGLLVSYRTNEINLVASFAAFLLTQTTVFSMELSPLVKVAAVLLVTALSVVFLLKGLPLLILWISVVLIKLLRLRSWSLFFLALAAALLPFGGGLGSPMHSLFAIILAVYVTPLGWPKAEEALSFFDPRYVIGILAAATVVLLMVRLGIEVPIVTKAASPLLTERERTYQLENILVWIHNSDYCGYEIAFVEDSGSPVASVESAITRRNRPPAPIGDVELYWNRVLRCHSGGRLNNQSGTAVVTFGGPQLAGLNPVFQIEGRYAGDATVWIGVPGSDGSGKGKQ